MLQGEQLSSCILNSSWLGFTEQFLFFSFTMLFILSPTSIQTQSDNWAENNIYFFFSVKKLLRFGSSLRSPEAGSVCEREGPADPWRSHCTLIRCTQSFISASSRAWKRYSAPFASLKNYDRLMLSEENTHKPKDRKVIWRLKRNHE